jgi:hypothetical protein
MNEETIVSIEKGGERYYPVPAVGDMFGYNRIHSFQAFRRNFRYLKGKYIELNMSSKRDMEAISYLAGKMFLVSAFRLHFSKLLEERQKKRTTAIFSNSYIEIGDSAADLLSPSEVL